MKFVKKTSLFALLIALILHVAALLFFNLSSLEVRPYIVDENVVLEIDYTEDEEEQEVEEQEIDLNNQSLANLMQDIQNIRKKSYQNYSEAQIEAELLQQIETENKQSVKELREKGIKGYDESKFDLNPNAKKKENKKKTQQTGTNSYAGSVTAVCNVPGRKCFTEKPTYICKGGGKVYVEIKVDKLGRVKNASVNTTKSTTTNECILNNALDYARSTTRVNSDLKGNNTQKGYIIYNFIAQ